MRLGFYKADQFSSTSHMMTLYDDGMRTIIEIPQALVNKIDSVSKARGVSRAAAIRTAIAEYLDRLSISEPTEDSAFGIWKGRVKDGLSYQRSLRDEWK